MSLGKVPERMVEPEAIEPSTSGNHDNSESGNHQAPSQWEQWNNNTYHILTITRKRKGEKAGSESTENRQLANKHVKWINLKGWTVKQKMPLRQPPGHPASPLRGGLLTSIVSSLT